MDWPCSNASVDLVASKINKIYHIKNCKTSYVKKGRNEKEKKYNAWTNRYAFEYTQNSQTCKKPTKQSKHGELKAVD